MTVRKRWDWVSLVTVALTVCSCRVNPNPVRLEAAPVAGFAPIWVNRDLKPIGQLTPIGSVMVGMVVDDYSLFLIGLDPATGHMRWRHQLAHSHVTPGEPVTVMRIGT